MSKHLSEEYTPSLVQCIFNTSTSLNITSLRSSGIFYSITLMNGTTNGKQLGAANMLYDSVLAVNVQSSSTSIISLWAHVLAVLLSALTLCLL
ncbi:hypothetical protein KOW79_006061 [Hemibagrus wyckioides]|uniref:Uncharacterized protein n=1 Tax=Hemibagrus wyckioides TaxID=337641 RepID=A0A9D3SS59_9TELE|nr:hypothetical protein KOW79_006061 [Hemibagrus wyckioides]